jgi:GGDEF domain-containing protein
MSFRFVTPRGVLWADTLARAIKSKTGRLVLNGCRTQMGASRAENIRHAIGERPVETATGPVVVSMSLGVAGTEDWQDSNAEQLIKEADVALYRAKELGRNRAVLAKPSGLKEIRAFQMTPHPVSAA